MDLQDTSTVVTPEQVAVEYRLAGIGTRFGAMVVDTLVQLVGVGLVVWLVAALLNTESPSAGGLTAVQRMVPTWLLALAVLAFFGLLWGYFIFWETIWSGQTPGKRLAGIRVLRDGGYPLDFRAAFLRNIARYVDFLPLAYGVGALCAFLSPGGKRLGDYVAGTIVVADPGRVGLPPAESASGRGPAEHPLLGDPSLLNLRAISREQFRLVERFLDRREELPEKVRGELAATIAAPLLAALGLEPPSDDRYPYSAFLAELAQAYRSRGSG